MDVEQSDVAIALFVYNRPNRAEELLRSISSRPEILQLPVYIYSDGPKKSVKGDQEKVGIVRDICQQYSNFTLIEQPSNIGLANSIVGGVSSVLKKHESIIVLEDDLELAEDFFDFMLTMLARYRFHPRVFHISGYMIPTSKQLPELGLYRLPGSWGWATWRDKWQHYTHDIHLLINKVKAKGLSAFNVDDSFNHFATLEENASGARDTWAIRWYATLYLNNGYSLYPHKSFVRNRGFDKEATNCKESDLLYQVDLRHRRNFWSDCDLPDIESSSYLSAYKAFHQQLIESWNPSITLKQRVKSKLKRILGK
ncbi:glycosyltransferase [Cerasicoccus maritimus]|uniref:glycosyltransferase n=1 Tax=Cerasicoccus maritimus TaxID=490089 RepID=UPI0028524BB6|nr:glycosyltransferase [Cerasicoccus maritimus]